MVDQGHLDYSKNVADYWPEFAQAGKESVTVADVMRHEADLYKLSKPVDLEWTYTDAIKDNQIGSIIEKETL